MRDRLQKELDQIFQMTSNLAINNKDSIMRVSHVVFATMASPNIVSSIIIERLGAKVDDLMIDLETNYRKESDQKYNQNVPPQWSEVLKNLVNNSIRNLAVGDVVSVEAFFLAMFETNDPSIDILAKHKITKPVIEEGIRDSRMASNVNMHDEDESDLNLRPKQRKSTKTPFLDDFGRDLTELAAKGLLDPVYNRIDETERLAQVLSRRKKNNPVLIGNAGCVLGATKIRIKKISDLTMHKIITI